MLNQIKQFFFLLGIFSLIAVFYITKKRIEIGKLKDLIKKDYKKKINKLKSEEDNLKKSLPSTEVKKLEKEINELNNKKEEYKDKISNLDKDDLVSAIDTWYKSR